MTAKVVPGGPVEGGGAGGFRRRPRYRGTHPARFEEKYKERDPARWPELREHVLSRGKTPAGTHVPVLLEEVLTFLDPRPGEVAVDATLGWGGHAEALLPRLLPGGRLLGLDADPIELPRTVERLRALGYGEPVFKGVRSSFAGLPRILATEGLSGADLLLADLGVSSMQLDDPSRGFSHKRDGPLDLRLNPRHGRPASWHLARLDEASLARLLVENADEPNAAAIARAILAASPVTTTAALAAAVRSATEPTPASRRERPGDAVAGDAIARAFQALRMHVNEEGPALAALLATLPDCVRAGGRIVFLTFHSGEDRLVKKAFQAGERSGVYGRVAHEVVRPSAEERYRNPRSASAKLRWAVRA